MNKDKDKQDQASSVRNGLGNLTEELSSPAVLYTQIREKDRLLREYKFKYETTKTLYEELLSVLIAQGEQPVGDISSRQGLLQVCQYIEEELSVLHLKKPDINRIKLTLMDRLEKTFFPKLKSASSFVSSSPKLERPNSHIVSHTGKLSSTNNSMNSETLISLSHRDKEMETDYFRRGARKLHQGRAEPASGHGNALASFKEYLITKKQDHLQTPNVGGTPLSRSKFEDLVAEPARTSRHSSRGLNPRVHTVK